MSNYPNTTLTNAGQDLIAESIAEGKALIFTKVELGDGNLTAGQSISTLTALISSKMNVPLSSGSADNGQAKLRFAVGNSGLEEGFFAREVGVFAKAGADGVETLYAYTNGGNYVDFIPDQSRPIDDQIMDVYIVTGNAAEVQIQVDSAAYATVADLNEHNESADSHPLTIDDTVAPTSDTAPMPTILNNVANMLKAISGESGWKGVPGKSLAALVSSLSTGITVAADGTFSNPTLGISCLMATNGYICFGPNFGGLILQWGYHATNDTPTAAGLPLYFPTAFTSTVYRVVATDVGANLLISTNPAAVNYANWNAKNIHGELHSAYFYWIAVGR
ncbi:MAG: phage tail protein [Selenomonas sp.]|nr:phage tail protein [Selenomonas sp.]